MPARPCTICFDLTDTDIYVDDQQYPAAVCEPCAAALTRSLTDRERRWTVRRPA